MPNVTEIYTLVTQSSYLSDGVKQALEGLLRAIPPALKISDNITFYSNDSVSTNPVDVDTGSGSRPLVAVVESRGTAGFLRLYNQAGSASVTASDELGPDLVVPVATTSGEITALSMHGTSFANFWGAGLVVATATTSCGAGAGRATMTNLPRIYLLYVNA